MANSNTKFGFQKDSYSRGSFLFEGQTTQEICHKQEDTWDPVATDWKSEQHSRLSDATQPKTQFLQCLIERLSLGTHTAPGGEAVSTGQVPAATPRQSLAKAVAGSSCWSTLCPSQQAVTHLHSQRI